ncbi:hypothetical protein SAV14893_036210 [Streptomyces avermitilis]|uniref:Uncharacterized protein n=1 Tax=Streptomyces avermitilis TaxID=33903 RepID=A0A4D4LZC1_STRAX|nr:hypothetical protein SAV14893_036210 [Streptomyces avermitilis]
MGLVGDLDGTAGAVERLGAFVGVLVRGSYGVRPSGAVGGPGRPGLRGLAGLRLRPGRVLRALGGGLGRGAELAAPTRAVGLVRRRRRRLGLGRGWAWAPGLFCAAA